MLGENYKLRNIVRSGFLYGNKAQLKWHTEEIPILRNRREKKRKDFMGTLPLTMHVVLQVENVQECFIKKCVITRTKNKLHLHGNIATLTCDQALFVFRFI